MPETTAANAVPPDDMASSRLTAPTQGAVAAGVRPRVPLWAAAGVAVVALLVGVGAGLAGSVRAVDQAKAERDQALAQLSLVRDELQSAQQDLADAQEQLADQPAADPDCLQPPDVGGLAGYTPFAYGDNGSHTTSVMASPATMSSAWLPTP